MGLIENTFFGSVDKIEIAIARMKEFEPDEGYYLAFSGGKDSQCIYHLAIESGVKFDAHYNLTTVDPPELVRFIKDEYPEVKIEMPEMSMWKLIVKNKYPPTRIIRYCCRILKERGGRGRLVMTGIRSEESSKRKSRQIIEVCYTDNSRRFLHPIIDWKEEDVWEYIKKRGLKYCKLYNEGYSRIGCIMCPMKPLKGRERDIKRYPKYYKGYLRAFGKMIQHRKDSGLTCDWETPEEVMEWWVYGNQNKKEYIDPDQLNIFV